MLSFTGFESNVIVGNKSTRVMFYADDFTDEEKQKIKEFKEYCKTNKLKIPDNDPEILRYLVSRKMDPKLAY